jgi:RNA polymerase sigma-70 factor (ECF subfamily)
MREPTRDVSDAMLLAEVCSGCRTCFSQLFMRYYSNVLVCVLQVLRDRTEAEDIAQEVFISILQKRAYYDASRGSVKTWIITIAHFKALQRRRYLNHHRFNALSEVDDLDQCPVLPRWQTYGMGPFERARFLETGLGRLSPQQRQAIELIHFEGYTLNEAAHLMREGLSNIKNLYYRGMRTLRDFLNTAQASNSNYGETDRQQPTLEQSYPVGLQKSPGGIA